MEAHEVQPGCGQGIRVGRMIKKLREKLADFFYDLMFLAEEDRAYDLCCDFAGECGYGNCDSCEPDGWEGC